ncbi:sensor histidine kinase [Vibrio sp. SS-MA-C1-2]|uniref:ATP-binding protein n=1 Tax=Vibrio sp. SS-MA-C1-2 TaxID=2908646 RepID=UPI001F3D99A1|nr:DUF3404 domain-containing protein [Vibrio sp. SS-MA-C1-2]UJF17317.1 sensor histidine kinase [Vibrio sp. SS-MA-C1-2]
MRSLFIVLIITFSPLTMAAINIPQQLEQLRLELINSSSLASYNKNNIERDYPPQLLLPDSMLPQTDKYPLRALIQLYKNSETCDGPWPVTPLLTQPLVFTQATCAQRQLPIGWFARSGYIHPGGGTYAQRYIHKYPNLRPLIQKYRHIKERPTAVATSLLGRLQRMDQSAMSALLKGSDTFLSDGELWLRSEDIYMVFKTSIWQSAASNNQLSLKLKKNADFCSYQTGNICWNSDSSFEPNFIIGLLASLNVILLVGWLIYRWKVKRREFQQRTLILQILTHELRTPIASLGMTVEQFRRDFDLMPEDFYDPFRRLCEDSVKLRQLAEASKDYLQADQEELRRDELESINDWLEYITEELDITLDLAEDRSGSLNQYWLNNCIENLVKNAKKYGVGEVKLTTQYKKNKLLISVSDEGMLSAKDWQKIRAPFETKSGLGLGLTIVESMVKRMGGKIKLEGPPTTFILEIPYE